LNNLEPFNLVEEAKKIKSNGMVQKEWKKNTTNF
jgi:hypothetical protein